MPISLCSLSLSARKEMWRYFHSSNSFDSYVLNSNNIIITKFSLPFISWLLMSADVYTEKLPLENIPRILAWKLLHPSALAWLCSHEARHFNKSKSCQYQPLLKISPPFFPFFLFRKVSSVYFTFPKVQHHYFCLEMTFFVLCVLIFSQFTFYISKYYYLNTLLSQHLQKEEWRWFNTFHFKEFF